jgi:hypothetical protein
MKINDATWFTQMGDVGCIGIVFCEDEHTGEKKAYIGCGDGFNEQADMEGIVNTGGKLTVEDLNRFISKLTDT